MELLNCLNQTYNSSYRFTKWWFKNVDVYPKTVILKCSWVKSFSENLFNQWKYAIIFVKHFSWIYVKGSRKATLK